MKLSETAIEIIDGDRGKNYPNSFADTGYCLFLSAKNVTNLGFNFTQCQFITQERDKLLNKGKLSRDDVVMTTRGTVGNIALYDSAVPFENVRINSGMVILRANPHSVVPQYLYYVMKSADVQQQIVQMRTGSAQPQFPISHMVNLEIPLPSLLEQRKIADTLLAIDARIAANKAINHHLEQMAQAIFKSWFVDFEPFGGTMPENWREGTLGQFVDIKRGGSPRPIQEFLSDTGLRWLKISDVTSIQTPFVLEIKEHIKESGLRKTVFLKASALVLSNSATPGIPKILGVDTCIHDGWLYFPSSLFSNEYLYLFFKYIRKDLVALGNGSVFTNLKTDILKNYAVNVPDEHILQQFDDLIVPLFREMEFRTHESSKLTELRNTLLPRLMSGELSVADI